MLNKQAIKELLSELLPSYAEVEYELSQEDFTAKFCWLLNSDPGRPYKRIRKVNFIITAKALHDFIYIGNKCEASLYIDLETYIIHQLERFEAEHDTPEGKAQPVVEWKIDSLYFLESLNFGKDIKRRMF